MSASDYRLNKVLALPEPDYPRVGIRLLFEPRDLWIGLFWVHDIQGWDGGWWESWRFYFILIPALVLRIEVDRSNRDTRAYRRWKRYL